MIGDFFKKWANPSLFFFIFVFSIQLTVNIQYTFCPWLDSNSGPLESEATALPTEPQPLPLIGVVFKKTNDTWKEAGLIF